MKIVAGRVKAAIEAIGAITKEGTVTYEVADKVSDMVVALDEVLRKVGAMEKAILGGRDRLTTDDPKFSEVMTELNKVYESEMDVDIEPLSAGMLKDFKVNPMSLAALKLAGLISK